MAGREKHPLSDLFTLTNFGVNLTRLVLGAGSALRHALTRQDEFVYILQGNPVLVTDAGETQLQACVPDSKQGSVTHIGCTASRLKT